MSFDYRVVVQSIANRFGYRILSLKDPVVDRDERFQRVYRRSKPFTMTSKERMYALYKAVEYVVESKIPGDFVECGVWRGGSAMLIADTLREMGVTDRKIWLYDTFEGMTQPTKDDYRVSNNTISALSRWQKEQKKKEVVWCYASQSEVEHNMGLIGYPKENVLFVKGKVEHTIPGAMPSKIAILRLDTDWYESTKHELAHLFPALVCRGILLVDDYGHWAGSKKAVDEYFQHSPLLLTRIDVDGRIAVKP